MSDSDITLHVEVDGSQASQAIRDTRVKLGELAGYITYVTGDVVSYELDLGETHVLSHNCHQAVHHGTVTAVETDGVNGAQVVTVEFDCGLTRDILASELSLA